jgi:hypothetical protein
LITLLKLLRACPDRYKQRAQVPHQVPKPAVMKQTCQHPLLFRFALQRLYTLKHQMFMYMDVRYHRISSFSCSFPEAALLLYRFQSDLGCFATQSSASVICSLRVYGVGCGHTSAKRRIRVAYLGCDQERLPVKR